jgi:hypothetical protein
VGPALRQTVSPVTLGNPVADLLPLHVNSEVEPLSQALQPDVLESMLVQPSSSMIVVHVDHPLAASSHGSQLVGATSTVELTTGATEAYLDTSVEAASLGLDEPNNRPINSNSNPKALVSLRCTEGAQDPPA